MRNFLFAAVLFFGVTATSIAGVSEGVFAYLQGDSKAALREWQPLAKQGNPRAQVYLGILYERGHAVRKDYKQALVWYQLAAEKGDADAQYFIGSMHEWGRGVPKNKIEADKWYQLASANGNRFAQAKTGNISVANQSATANHTLDKSCSSCHETGKNGAPVVGDKVAWTPRIDSGQEALLKSVKDLLNSLPPNSAVALSDDEIKTQINVLLKTAMQ